MSLTMKPCMIAAGPTPKPCIIQIEPMPTISRPTRLVTIRIKMSNALRIESLRSNRLLAGVDVEDALPFRRHAVANLLVLDGAGGYRQTLGLGLGDLAFVGALARQRMRDGAVALVARILEHLVAGARGDHEPDRPRRRVCTGIVDARNVLDHRGVDTREALRELQLLAVRRPT